MVMIIVLGLNFGPVERLPCCVDGWHGHGRGGRGDHGRRASHV